MGLFESMEGMDIPKTDAERNEVVVTEHAKSYWNYHLSRRNNIMRSLCGTATMPTVMPLSAWGVETREKLPKPPTWCQKCADIAWPDGKKPG